MRFKQTMPNANFQEKALCKKVVQFISEWQMKNKKYLPIAIGFCIITWNGNKKKKWIVSILMVSIIKLCMLIDSQSEISMEKNTETENV